MYGNEENNTPIDNETKSFDINEPVIDTIQPIPAPAQYYAPPPKKRKLSKGALTIYLLIVAILYAVVVFLSVAVSNNAPAIDENQIDNGYVQTYDA